MTANILGPYDNNGQTLAPAGAVTVSGTMISLAPGGSDVAVGAGTKALSANNTAGFVSGPNTTGVQSFEGSALGGKDGLWSSSMVVLVGVAVLLWL